MAPAPPGEWTNGAHTRVAAAIARLFPHADVSALMERVDFVGHGEATPMSLAIDTSKGRANWRLLCSQRVVEMFDDAELRAVLGHELSHVALGHIYLINAFQEAVLDGATGSFLRRVPQVQAWATRIERNAFAAMRGNELAADVGAIALTRDPEALISATRRLDADLHARRSAAGLPPRVEPPRAERTHPPLRRRLEVMAEAGNRLDDLVVPDITRPVRPRLAGGPVDWRQSCGLGH